MPLTPDIAVSQSALTPNLVTILDDSGGSDIAITQRRVYVQDSTGTYLVPSGTSTQYTQWSISDASIDLNILTQDEAVDILVQWLDVSNNVLYTFEDQYPLAEYNKQFLYQLVQLQGITPGIVQDANYSGNIAIFWTNIIAGINAVTFGASISAAQNCFNRATFMRINQNDFF